MTRAALAALAVTGSLSGSNATAAADPATILQQLRHMTPAQIQAWAQQQRAVRAAGALSDSDVTPPVITTFDAPASIDVGVPDSPLYVTVKGSDDLSGVYWGYAYGFGPSGQLFNASLNVSFPTKKLSSAMDVYSLSSFSEPGTYSFMAAFFFDAAGNQISLDQAALAALGRTSFVVKSKRGFDAVNPALQSGQILTPKVSLSATHPGTDEPPFVAVSIDVADSGNTVIAGVSSAGADFCLLDQSRCFSVYANDVNGPRRVAAETLRLGGRIDPSNLVPGKYHLRTVFVNDYGGNYEYLQSTEFGGAADFSAYFPSTTITVKP
jgi:hypothetical protein